MTKEEFIKKVDEKYGVGRYTIIGEYKNNKSKILVKCNKCGYEWETGKAYSIQSACPKCKVGDIHYDINGGNNDNQEQRIEENA